MSTAPNNHQLTRGRAIALAATIALALIMLLPGAWGAALAQTAGPGDGTGDPTPTSVTVDADQGAVLSVPEAGFTLIIPAGALPGDTEVEYTPSFNSDDDASAAQNQAEAINVLAALGLPAPMVEGGASSAILQIFQLEAPSLADGATFSTPVILAFVVSPEALAVGGGDAANVSLAFFNAATGTWVPVSCTGSGTGVTCELPHFSHWALIVSEPAAVVPAPPAPPVVAPAPADTGMGLEGAGSQASTFAWLLTAVVTLGAVSGIGARAMVARRRVEE